MGEPIAIVGMAALFPGAPDAATFWRNIVAGVDAITDAPPGRWDPALYDPSATGGADRFYCRRGGFVDELATFDPARFGVMPVAVDGTEPDQLLALAVAAAAIDDAGGESRLGDRSRVGVVLGRGGYLSPGVARLDQRVRTAHQVVAVLRDLVPGLAPEQLAAVREAFCARLGPERPESSIGLVPNLAASRIANRLDLAGPAYTVDAACASSLIAVDTAVRELRAGRCDTVLAGGVHHCHDVTLWSVFTQLGALSRAQRIRPFDAAADGILIGEGTGVVVLKRLTDAQRAGDRVYAVVRGTGVASDGRASSLMAPRPDGQIRAIEAAWADAHLDPADAPGLIEAHGTATAAGDATELASLTRVFGATGPEIGLGSVKSMIGHAMPAAGIAGLIKAAYAVWAGVLPPTLHCDDPHPALAGSRFTPITVAREWPAALRRAGVNAFGFGGINAHVILENAETAPPAATAVPVATAGGSGVERVLLLAGASPADLVTALALPDSALLTRDDVHTPPTGPCRLAIVAPTARRLALARRVLAQGEPWRGRNDIWFAPEPLLSGGGRLAYVFPGLEQTFSPRIDDVAAHFGLSAPAAASGQLGEHGLAVVGVGRVLDHALRELGIAPDVIAGHSVGEWSAMIASSMYPADAVDDFIARFDTAALEVPGVVFAALGCGAAEAAEAIAGLPDVVVSHDNCPHQSIICGAEESVDAALARLRSVPAQILAFRSGFHAPMLAPYLGPIRDSFASMPIRAPRTPVWSATTVAEYPTDPDAIRRLAIRHLVEPVRFRELTERLHGAGVRVFVQVGTGSVRGFVDDTLGGTDHLAISANEPTRAGLDQLRRLAAALWVEGAAPRFDRLPCASPRPATGTVRLTLGSTLVSLDGALPPLVDLAPGRPHRTVQPERSRHQVADPLLAEFEALLADASDAAADVLAARTTTPRTTSPRASGRAVPAPAAPETAPAHAPAPARAAAPAPAPAAPVRRGDQRVFSVETMPYLLDHCFYRQRPGWTDVADRYPVVPMTTLLEVMREAARERAPGRVCVGFREVRALRWLAAAPPATASLTANLDPDGNVTVVIDGYTRGTVLLADDYPPAPNLADGPLTAPRPVPFGADRLYADRWMFHGPAFQGIAELTELGTDGIRGTIAAPATPGALLDNAGQLMGLWIMLSADVDRLAFPGAISAIELFGPDPAAGERIGCTVRIRVVSDTDVTADLELRRPDGSLWCRIEGWKDRRFGTDEVTWASFTAPEITTIAEEQPGGWFLARERWHDTATRELIMRRYLCGAERAEYATKNPRAQRQWLLGRIAVKDAVRTYLWRRGAGPLFPAEILVHNDADGRPHATGPAGERPHVSLAHTGAVAVAIATHRTAGHHGVGIDVEPVIARDGLADTALTANEREHAGEDPGELLRYWTAKEAAAKAEGTGLAGRPRAFEAEPAGLDGLLVRAPGGRTHLVRTALIDTAGGAHAVAWTDPSDDATDHATDDTTAEASDHATDRATTDRRYR